jgi:hypothetical protein
MFNLVLIGLLVLAFVFLAIGVLTNRRKPNPKDVADLLTQLEHLEDDACDEGQSYSYGGRVNRDLIDRLRASVGLKAMVPLEIRKRM